MCTTYQTILQAALQHTSENHMFGKMLRLENVSKQTLETVGTASTYQKFIFHIGMI